MQTLLLKNAKIVDGTGQPSTRGHILIRGERIEAVFDHSQALPQADQIIDIAGDVVAPGFIDMHSHMDWVVPRKDHPDLLKCFVKQGITTLVTGHCGFSPAPFLTDPKRMFDYHIPTTIFGEQLAFNWNAMEDFLNYLADIKPLFNIAQLAGHATVRLNGTSVIRGPMPKSDLQNCVRILRQCLDQGACGVSFGLGYDPGMFSPLDEITAFCQAAKEAEKCVNVHLKAYSRVSPVYPAWHLKPHNLTALTEMVEIARKTGARLQISHFIFVGKRTWKTADACLDLVQKARRKGVDVKVDAFPFTCGNTTIHALFPYWFLRSIPKIYQNRSAMLRLYAETEIGFCMIGLCYDDIVIMDAAREQWQHLNGKSIAQIAGIWKTSPFKTLLKISRITHGEALVLIHGYSGDANDQDGLEKVLACPHCLFETDALVKPTGIYNPAAIGTFPKILGEFVREQKLLTLEDAISRMTYKSAMRFGFKDRGKLAPGMAADIVVFNPDNIAAPHRPLYHHASLPDFFVPGMAHVFINGQQVIESNAYIDGIRPGKVLR